MNFTNLMYEFWLNAKWMTAFSENEVITLSRCSKYNWNKIKAQTSIKLSVDVVSIEN